MGLVREGVFSEVPCVGRARPSRQCPLISKALRSADYHSILAKIAKVGPDAMAFTKAQVQSGLTDSEKRKFNNFLRKMKRLNVIRSGDVRGEYVFNTRMARLHIWLSNVQEPRGSV